MINVLNFINNLFKNANKKYLTFFIFQHFDMFKFFKKYFFLKLQVFIFKLLFYYIIQNKKKNIQL